MWRASFGERRILENVERKLVTEMRIIEN